MGFFNTLGKINLATAKQTPTILSAVQAVEALGENKTGAEKLSAVTSVVIQSLESSSNVNAQTIGATASLIVLAANILGVFLHRTPNAPAPAKPSTLIPNSGA